MKISMIVAYGNNWEIGFDNKMLWYIPEDFKNFKKITSGHCILMGRKTFESIGKPLPNRTSIILSRKPFNQEGTHSFTDVEEVIKFAEETGEEELFVIGGAQIYKLMMPYISKMYISHVDYSADENNKVDTYLDPINLNDWNMAETWSFLSVGETPAWDFKVYTRKE